MAKKKKRASKKSKPVATHTLPAGFWPQVGAVVLVVLALLLTLGIFGSGGPFPEATYSAGKALLGWAVFILPFLFVYRAVQTFKGAWRRHRCNDPFHGRGCWFRPAYAGKPSCF